MSDILTGPDRGPPKFDWRREAERLQRELDIANEELKLTRELLAAAISDGAKR